MKSPAGILRVLVSAGGAVLAALFPAAAAPPPATLSAPNAASSVWDTDPSKVGVELQIVNHGAAAADDVRVTSVAVQGGALAAFTPLPIALGNIAPQGSALLDLVITVPRTDGTGYLLTIFGTYRSSGGSQHFSLTREVTPSAAPPGPTRTTSGVSDKSSSQPAGPVGPHGVGGPPGFGPNATTPMLIPPGPPRGPSPPNPGEAGPATQQR